MSILFCAIFYGVSFAIKNGELIQNPVNTPQKIGEPDAKNKKRVTLTLTSVLLTGTFYKKYDIYRNNNRVVPQRRIELRINPYHGSVIPLNY